MVKFTVDELRAIMGQQGRVRNISVIAHVDHGKSTLTDSLIARAGYLSESKAGSSTYLDGREDEKNRGITIKSSGISLGIDYEGPYLINLIDSPGHVDFSSEVTAALRVTDGAILVIDCVEGVCVQTETVLRQALLEKVKPVLMINKLDRFILELQQSPEEIYQAIVKIIDNVNNIISTFEDPLMGDLTLDPLKGNVVFGSGKMNWGFSLRDFAKIYAKQFNKDEDSLRKSLWGESYFDPKTAKWISSPFNEEGKKLERTFCKYVLKPIVKVCSDIENVDNLLPVLGVTLKDEERKKSEKELIKTVMHKWLPLSETLLMMITEHLPAPNEAQRYRVQHLYTGPMDDALAEGIRNCDPEGPLMVYISKLIPSAGTFIAFGRIFSGTLRAGMRVKIMAPDVLHKNVQKAVVVMGTNFETVDDVPAGNTLGIVGIDGCLTKTGTVSSLEEAFPMKDMQFSVSPVVRVAVRPKNPAEIAKLIKGIDRLNKTDPLLVCSKDPTGEIIISGSGELHIEIALNDLKAYSNIELVVSDPVVPYQEGILTDSSDVVLAKSQNKHNRVYVKAFPLEEALVNDMDKNGESVLRQHGWNDLRNVWAFTGPNMLVNATHGVNYIQEVRDSICTGFQMAASEGVLCNEPMRGVCFSLEDGLFHSDNAHRGANQVVRAARRACYGAYLSGNPSIYEPVYLVSIQCTQRAIAGTYNVLNLRRGEVFSQEMIENGQIAIIQAYLPVVESFGFNGELRAATAGQAFPQCAFSHWQCMAGSPLEDGSKTNTVVREIRKRKGLKAELPVLSDYVDRL